MSRFGSCSRGVLVVLLLAPVGAAQQQLPHPNPLQGLRGAPSRGVATIGQPSRGFTTRAMARRVPLETIVTEADARREADDRAAETRRVPPDATPAMVMAARAAELLAAGNQSEALAVLEDVLALDADEPLALELLEAVEPRGNLPDDPRAAIEELLVRGSGATRTRRELVVHQLRDLGLRHRNELELRLRLALLAPEAERRVFAAHALLRLFPGQAQGLLVRRALRDELPEVRRSAVWALGARTQPAAFDMLRAALSATSDPVRLHAVQALGQLGDPRAVELLVAQFDVLLAPGAPFEPALIRAVKDALHQLTGLTAHNDARAWQAWWQSKGPAWVAAQPASP